MSLIAEDIAGIELAEGGQASGGEGTGEPGAAPGEANAVSGKPGSAFGWGKDAQVINAAEYKM